MFYVFIFLCQFLYMISNEGYPNLFIKQTAKQSKNKYFSISLSILKLAKDRSKHFIALSRRPAFKKISLNSENAVSSWYHVEVSLGLIVRKTFFFFLPFFKENQRKIVFLTIFTNLFLSFHYSFFMFFFFFVHYYHYYSFIHL